tara:strand:- start:2956 stop:3972 length:1017 start_codon:yes stop_codon:yes gene_type:complete
MTQTGSVSISVNGTTNQIQRHDGGSFVTDGFTAGQTITLAGSANNKGKYTLEAVFTSYLWLNESVTTESSTDMTVLSSENVLYNNQYITSRIENADSNALQHFVFLNLKSRSIPNKEWAEDNIASAFETNRIGLKIESYSVNTSRTLPSFPIPSIGVITGESETIGIDLGMATKNISMNGTLIGQRIIKSFDDVGEGEPSEVSVMMTASEVAQLIHSYVDSSAFQKQQRLNELVILMPSRVNHKYEYHDGLAEATDDSTLTPEEYLPMIPFSFRSRNQDNKGTIYNVIPDHAFAEFKPIHSESNIAGLGGFVRSFNTTHTAGQPEITFTMDFEIARIL